MKQVYGDELKRIQLEILDVVVDFCTQHNINYWLTCGTLLGAVRHKSYIPWDDDIDIGMLRPEYDRFMLLFNEHNDRYRLYSIENNKEFLYPFGKVLDTSTLLYEPDLNGNKLSINIDVFVYDNAPDSELSLFLMYKTKDILKRFLAIQQSKNRPRGNFLIRTVKKLVRFALKILPSNYFIRLIAKNSRRYENKDTSRVGNFTSYTNMVCEKNVFDRFLDMSFENKKYKVPIGYDKWLTAFYGDYMKLPPIEKQVSHHSFIAYVKEN